MDTAQLELDYDAVPLNWYQWMLRLMDGELEFEGVTSTLETCSEAAGEIWWRRRPGLKRRHDPVPFPERPKALKSLDIFVF